MIICRKCGANCDPGDIVGGQCLDCMEQERQMQVRSEHAFRIMTSPWYQMNLSEVIGMRISKIKIKNLFGIKEYEMDGTSVELSGANGVGKTSIIDAIRLALTNKSNRDYTVRKGETEGEIIVETDNGIRIDRKIRTNQADYKSIKKDGREVGSPETFLKDIFSPLQLSPVEFLDMDKKKQNAVILDMIEYPWDMGTIKEWFGEIPSWVSYDQNILQILNDIQSENGDYFKERQDINRDIRNKKAFIEEIATTIPANYEVAKWENANLGELYKQIEQIRKSNELIEKAKTYIEQRDNKVRSFEADREINISVIDREFANREQQISKDILKYEQIIKKLETELEGLSEKKKDKLSVIEAKFNEAVSKYDAEVEQYKPYADKVPCDYSDLSQQAAETERMKSYINEYHRMVSLQEEVEGLKNQSDQLTAKIELARTLPGTILETATIPINGLTVENGIPLINGLPVSNLSEGEKLDLCIDVALQKPNGLQIILIDGVEKLSTDLRNELYQKCKQKGLQFIATRTTDDSDITVMEF